jgi:DNA-binding NtrC family response regulator
MSNVVIIEDDALMRALMTEWLTAAGYRVHAVAGVDGATFPPADVVPPAVVIVGVYMPRQLGAERLRSTRKAYPGVPIIAISGQFRAGVDYSGSAAKALGVESVIPKPCEREALLRVVRSATAAPH